MNFEPETIVALVGAMGMGTIFSAVISWLKDRKKVSSDTAKTDVDTKLAYLNTVIERLDAEVRRVISDRDRVNQELEEERLASAGLRKRVRELEDEIDGVRRSARDTQNRCDDLALRVQDLVKDAQEK
jgi:uncharacterized protein (DUF3084 family)